MLDRFVRILAALLVLALAGCSAPMEPDLVRLYRPVARLPKPHPLIVIPGIMGSRLLRVDTGDEVWPGSLSGLLLGREWSDLALPVPGSEGIPGVPRPARLVAGGIFHEIAGNDFYGELIRNLEEAGGYRCVTRDQLTAATDCVLFAWDWRRGMVAAAADLDETIERLRSMRGDPALTVDIVAHSAAGLLTRYYVRYGGVDVLDAPLMEVPFDGGGKVHQAILIGTPNYGSITALQKAITGDRIVRSRLRPETIATMPGMFQLLPHPDRTWMLDSRGRRVEMDLFDAETWRRHRWSVWDPAVRERIRGNFPDAASAEAYLDLLETEFAQGLSRAARFHRALSRPSSRGTVKYVVFGSDCVPTAAHCVIEDVDGKASIALVPDDIRHPVAGVRYDELMIEPGDGAVTKASLLARDNLGIASADGDFPISRAIFVCEKHERLAGNPTFRDNLLNILLYGSEGIF